MKKCHVCEEKTIRRVAGLYLCRSCMVEATKARDEINETKKKEGKRLTGLKKVAERLKGEL